MDALFAMSCLTVVMQNSGAQTHVLYIRESDQVARRIALEIDEREVAILFRGKYTVASLCPFSNRNVGDAR